MIKTTVICDKCGKEEQLPIDKHWRETKPEESKMGFRGVSIYSLSFYKEGNMFDPIFIDGKILCESCDKKYNELLKQEQFKINQAIFDFWGNDNLNKLLDCPES